MRVLAIIDVADGVDAAQVRPRLEQELRGSWTLYSAGTLREAYATSLPTRVVFVLETASLDEAKAQLARLPLIASGALRFDLVELRPFVNWSLLFR